MRILSIDPAPKNCGVVKLNIDNSKIKIIDSQLFNFCGDKKVKQCSFESIIDKLIIQFSQYDCKNVDIVLIENIPSRLNMVTKSLSIAIYTHFAINGFTVKLVSPSRKLSKEENKLSYNERKNIGIKKAFDLIDKEDKLKLMEKFKAGKGLADVSDCIIQAYAWFEKNAHK